MRTVKRKQPAAYSAQVDTPGDIVNLCMKYKVPFDMRMNEEGKSTLFVGQPQFTCKATRELLDVDVVVFEPTNKVTIVNFYKFSEFNANFEDLNK